MLDVYCDILEANLNQMSDISKYAHKWLHLLPFVNIDKTNTENVCARAFAYLEN
jgi:hypothetical protein